MSWRGYLSYFVIIGGLLLLLAISASSARAQNVTVFYGYVERQLELGRFDARLFGETFEVRIVGVEPDLLQFCRANRPRAALAHWYADNYLVRGAEVLIQPVGAWSHGAIIARVSVIVESGKWADLRTLMAPDHGITTQPLAKPCARA